MLFHVYFSPHGGCEDQIVQNIRIAKNTINILSYTFTSKPIRDALIERKKAGVRIKFIGDKLAASEPSSLIRDLHDAGIECYTDGVHAIAHNKIIIIDELTVLGGSYNHTSAAENKNGENLTELWDAQIAGQYQGNWDLHCSHSVPYMPLATSFPIDLNAVENPLTQD